MHLHFFAPHFAIRSLVLRGFGRGIDTSGVTPNTRVILSVHSIDDFGDVLDDHTCRTILRRKQDVDDEGIPRVLDGMRKLRMVVCPCVEGLEVDRLYSVFSFRSVH